MRRRHLCIIFIALTFSLLAYSSSLLLFKPPVAQASSFVIGSDPIDGSTIASVPQEVHIYFNATISTLSSAHVLVVQQGTQNSSLVEVGTNTGIVSGPNSNELIIPLKQAQGLTQGSYLVRWTAIANDDGNTTFGNIGFNVGISSTGLPGTPILGPSTSNELDEIRALDTNHITNILLVAWEWIQIAALTLWIGILVMEQFVLSDGDRCKELHIYTKKQANSLQWLCLSALLCCEIVLLTLRTTALVQITHTSNTYLSTILSLLLNTNYGHFWLVQLVLICIAIGLFYRARRSSQQHVEPEPITHLPRSGTLRLTTSPRGEESGNSKVQTLRPAAAPARLRTGDRTGSVGTGLAPVHIPTEKENRHPRVWLLLSGSILLTLVLSRAPAQTFQTHISAILFDWLNIAALGIWFGSFVYLGYLILPLFNRKELEYHTETLVALLHRLTPFILGAIGIEIVSTLFLSEAAISEPQQLLSDPYGRTLLFQIGSFVIMLFLSLYTLLDREKPLTLRGKPLSLHSILKHQLLRLPLVYADLPARRLRQSELQQTKKSLRFTSIIITWLGIAILLCMALMTFFSPPIHFPTITYNNQSTGSTNTTSTQTQQIGDLSVSLQLLPGHSDETNTVIVFINDSNGKPVTDAQVSLTTNMQIMDMGTGKAVLNEGNPAYIATFDKGVTFNMSGLWLINVEIQRPNQNMIQGTFQVMVS